MLSGAGGAGGPGGAGDLVEVDGFFSKAASAREPYVWQSTGFPTQHNANAYGFAASGAFQRLTLCPAKCFAYMPFAEVGASS